MKLTYDPKHNIAYLRLRDGPAEVETIKISDELAVDLAPDGTVYGIELLNANAQLRGAGAGGHAGKFVLENECTGEQTELVVAA